MDPLDEPWAQYTLHDPEEILSFCDRIEPGARAEGVPEALAHIAVLRRLIAALCAGDVYPALHPPDVPKGSLRVSHSPDCPRRTTGRCTRRCAALRAA